MFVVLCKVGASEQPNGVQKLLLGIQPRLPPYTYGGFILLFCPNTMLEPHGFVPLSDLQIAQEDRVLT